MSQQVTPSRMNLMIFKQKIAASRKGYQLLKRKVDALKAKFRVVTIALLQKKKKMGSQIGEALLLFAQAQYAAGNFQQLFLNRNNVKEAVKKATIRVDKSQQNIAGVMLPVMAIKEIQQADNPMTQIGIQRGGQSIQKCREKFRECLFLVVDIASLQSSFVLLDEKIKVTNRRVNALQHVVIPKFQGQYRYIEQELDEMAKQDFCRLKKVLDNKKKVVLQSQLEKSKMSQKFQIKQDLLQQDEIMF